MTDTQASLSTSLGENLKRTLAIIEAVREMVHLAPDQPLPLPKPRLTVIEGGKVLHHG